MEISGNEMTRRQLVAKVQSAITDAIAKFVSDEPDGLTYMEVITALHNVQSRMVSEVMKNEWREQKE